MYKSLCEINFKISIKKFAKIFLLHLKCTQEKTKNIIEREKSYL